MPSERRLRFWTRRFVDSTFSQASSRPAGITTPDHGGGGPAFRRCITARCALRGSNSGLDQGHKPTAAELGLPLACAGLPILWGGRVNGCIGALAGEALSAGVWVTGVFPIHRASTGRKHERLTCVEVVGRPAGVLYFLRYQDHPVTSPMEATVILACALVPTSLPAASAAPRPKIPSPRCRSGLVPRVRAFVPD
jgi:hypothetical protein